MARAKPENRLSPYVPILIMTAGALLRLIGLGDRQLWLDELIQLQRFSGPDLVDNVLALRSEIAATPLDYVVQSVVVSLLGHSEFAVRCHAFLFGSLSLPVFFLIARRLFDRRTAILSLVLFAVYPLHYHYSREGRNYALFVFLTLSAYLLLLRAAERGGAGRWAAFGTVTSLNLYTNYLAGLVLVSQSVWVGSLLLGIIQRGLPGESWPRRKALIGFGISAGLAVLLFLPWVFWTFDSARADAPSALAEGGLALRVFKELTGGYPLSTLLAVCWGLGLRSLIRRRDRFTLLLLLSWGVLPVLVVLGLVWWREYIFAIRQLLFVTPALLLTAGAGLGGLRHDLGRSALDPVFRNGFPVLILLFSLGTILLRGNEEEADWKGVAAHLEQTVSTERVAAPGARFPLSFYLSDWEDKWVELEDAQRLVCEPGVVLVESRYTAKRQQQLAEALLESAEVLQRRTFKGFQVIHLGCRE